MFKILNLGKQFVKRINHKSRVCISKALKEMWVVNSPVAPHIGKNFEQIAIDAGKRSGGTFHGFVGRI